MSQIGNEPDEVVPPSAPEVGTELTDPRDLERPITDDVVITSTGGLEFDPTFAGFLPRFLGLVVDSILLNLAMLPGLVIILLADSAVAAVLGVLVAFIGFVLVTVIAARSIAKSRQWIGNRVAGTYVVDGINGSNIDAARAGTRLVIRHLISPVFLFGFLAAVADGQRRTFHDRIAGSVVIARTREVWVAE